MLDELNSLVNGAWDSALIITLWLCQQSPSLEAVHLEERFCSLIPTVHKEKEKANVLLESGALESTFKQS
jgi:hypothetical protein